MSGPGTGPSDSGRPRASGQASGLTGEMTTTAESTTSTDVSAVTAQPTWTAGFIAPVDESAVHGKAAVLFRKDFSAPGGVERAVLHVTALGIYEAFVNGVRVGDEVLAPGWTSYRHRLHYRSHDVTALVRDGDNTLGAYVGDGWARTRLAWNKDKRSTHHFAENAGLLAQLEITLDSGQTVLVGTDGSWRVSTDGPVTANSIYDGEDYDARKEISGWSEPGFDDTAWGPVTAVDWDLSKLLSAGDLEPVRRIEELAVREVITTPSGKTVLDFGQNLVGWVRFTVTGQAGSTVTLTHAEVMEHGELGTRPLRTAKQTDHYTLRDGEQSWEPRFTFHGFRYVQVDDWPGTLDPSAFTAVVVHCDMRRTGTFDSSHDLLNQLHRNTVWGMRGNFVSVPTDCPQRDERLGWTGDINAFGPSAAYLYDVRQVLGNWLEDLSAEHLDTGFVPLVVPDVLASNIDTALWGDVSVLLPWTLYVAYGDEKLLADNYASATAYVDRVAGKLHDGLWDTGFQFGDWLDPDAPPDRAADGKTDPHLLATAYFAHASRTLSRTAEILGKTEDAKRYAELSDMVRAAFQREYVAPSGRLVNESATAYALAIQFDLLSDEQRDRAGKALTKLVRKAGHRISTGFAGTPLVADALSSTGHMRDAYAMLLQTECPSFLYPVTMGATTIWERWDSMRPDGTINPGSMTSFNHYALGAVVDWVHRVVAGLAPAEPGYARLAVAPQPGGGITHASASLETPHGHAAVEWRRTGERVTLDVTVPQGVEADLTLPLHGDSEADGGTHQTVSSGRHHFDYVAVEPDSQFENFELQTPFDELRRDRVTWAELETLFRDVDAGMSFVTAEDDQTLDGLLAVSPGLSRQVRRKINAVLEAANERNLG